MQALIAVPPMSRHSVRGRASSTSTRSSPAGRAARADPSVELGLRQQPEPKGRFLERRALDVRLGGNACRGVVAHVRAQRGDQHQAAPEVTRDGLAVRLEPAHAMLGEGGTRVAEQANGLEHVVDQHRLVDVELEVAARRSQAHRDVVAHDLGADHQQGLGLRRIHLARHDRAAGLVLGQAQLADAATWPTAEPPDVVGDLGEGHGQSAQRTVRRRQRLVAGKRLELVGRAAQRQPAQLAEPRRRERGELGRGVEPRAHRRAAERNLAERR
jgi:hypothetical protein